MEYSVLWLIELIEALRNLYSTILWDYNINVTTHALLFRGTSRRCVLNLYWHREIPCSLNTSWIFLWYSIAFWCLLSHCGLLKIVLFHDVVLCGNISNKCYFPLCLYYILTTTEILKGYIVSGSIFLHNVKWKIATIMSFTLGYPPAKQLGTPGVRCCSALRPLMPWALIQYKDVILPV